MLLSLTHADVNAQNDIVLLTGQHESINVNIMELTKSFLTFKKNKDNTVVRLPVNNIDHIELKKSQGQKYFTSDLLQRLRTRNSNEIVWYGIDFTMIKIYDLANENNYSNGLFRLINNFIIEPSGKFYSLWFTGASGCLTGIKLQDLDPVNERNKRIQTQDCFMDNPRNSILLDTIRESVKNIKSVKCKEGIGMIFFYTLINKSTEQCNGYLVFFDICTKEIIFILKVNFKGYGISMEWHWTKGFLDVINEIRNDGESINSIYKIYELQMKN